MKLSPDYSVVGPTVCYMHVSGNKDFIFVALMDPSASRMSQDISLSLMSVGGSGT